MSPARSTSRKRCIGIVSFVLMSSVTGVVAWLLVSAAKSHFSSDSTVLGESIQWVESLRSLVVSVAVAAYFGVRWLQGRQHQSFERYFDGVTAIEKQAQMLEAVEPLDLKALERLRRHVTRIKSDALDRYASGTLRGEERMSAFLTHAIDIRNYVQDLILYERERLDERQLMLETRSRRRRRGMSERRTDIGFNNAQRTDFRAVVEAAVGD